MPGILAIHTDLLVRKLFVNILNAVIKCIIIIIIISIIEKQREPTPTIPLTLRTYFFLCRSNKVALVPFSHRNIVIEVYK